MPKIIATLTTTSKVGEQQLESRIERTARESVVGTFEHERVRVVVRMLPDGGALVETFRRAPDAAPGDRDPITWNDDASLHVPAEHEKPTLAELTPHTFLTATEPFPF